jgi:hypothetical protein
MDELKLSASKNLVERQDSFSDRALAELSSWSKEQKKDFEGMAQVAGIIAATVVGVAATGKLMDLAFFGTRKSYLARLESLNPTKNIELASENMELAPQSPVFKPTFQLSRNEVDSLSFSELAERSNFHTATKMGFLRDRLLMNDFHKPYQAGEIDIYAFQRLQEYSGQAMRSLPEVHVPGVNGVRFADDWSVRPIGSKQFDWESYYAKRPKPLVQQLSASY